MATCREVSLTSLTVKIAHVRCLRRNRRLSSTLICSTPNVCDFRSDLFGTFGKMGYHFFFIAHRECLHLFSAVRGLLYHWRFSFLVKFAQDQRTSPGPIAGDSTDSTQGRKVMPVRKTETRIPAGSSASDLGESTVATDPAPSPLCPFFPLPWLPTRKIPTCCL